MKSAASRALACERRKPAQVVAVRSGCGIDACLAQDFPDRRRGDFHAEYHQFAVHPPISPAAVFPGQAQHQDADRAQGAGSAASLGTGDGRVVASDQVAVPAHDSVRANQQPQTAQCRSRQRVQ
jgi:hypothetical protein